MTILNTRSAAALTSSPLLRRAVLAAGVPPSWDQPEGVPLEPGDMFDVEPCDEHEGRCWKTDALAGPWHMPHWVLVWA